jgi:glucose/mannose-6-phosphate isomerase
MAKDAGVPHLHVNWRDEPRAALGWSFATLLAICGELGLMPDVGPDLAPALHEMRAVVAECASDVAEDANPAKQLARRLAGRLPVFVGAEALAPVAYRWRTQVNENAKSWAIADELPEMNHNAQTGYGLPRRAVPLLHAVLLRHAGIHPRIALRFDATADEMRREGVSAEIVDLAGATLLAQILRAVQLGDFVSYYLGLLNGVEPSPVEALHRLKELLASHE